MIKSVMAIMTVLVTALFVQCEAPGVSTQRLGGGEGTLPEVLKGLKVYSVSIGRGEYINVAVINKEINSLTYIEGKQPKSVIIVKNSGYDQHEIKVKEILLEYNTIIIARK